MKIGDFIPPENVLLNLPASNKRDCLRALSDRAARSLELDGKLILHTLLAREALGSTGLGDGVAIPHARVPKIQLPFGLFARLDRPLDFDAIDAQPVDLVVLLLFPEVPQGDQLNVLACTARYLRDREFADRLRSEADEGGFYAQLKC